MTETNSVLLEHSVRKGFRRVTGSTILYTWCFRRSCHSAAILGKTPSLVFWNVGSCILILGWDTLRSGANLREWCTAGNTVATSPDDKRFLAVAQFNSCGKFLRSLFLFRCALAVINWPRWPSFSPRETSRWDKVSWVCLGKSISPGACIDLTQNSSPAHFGVYLNPP